MNSRTVSRKIIQRVLNENAYSNIVLSKELNESDLNDLDKGLVTELVYGVLRRKRTLDTIIASFVKDITVMEPETLNILRIAIYQMHFLDRIPDYAACNEAVEDAKDVSLKDSKLVNGILRSYLNAEKKIEVKGNKIDQLAYEYSFEPWMIRVLIKQYGEKDTITIMKGLNKTPTLTVRVNSTQGDYDEVFEKLEEKGYEVEEGIICPEAISIINGKAVDKNEMFNEGKVTVQDESAMLVAPMLDIKDGEKVLDLCAAPGGKTTHIAELLNNTGEVIAFDLHKNKLSLIEENMNRLKLSNIKLCEMDATKLNVDYVGYADKVLIDVPCSGIGIIRKKPEIKWTKRRNDLRELVPIQRSIMENAWHYLKPGGVMVYSTCTLNKEENEENLDWFLKNHKDAKTEKVFLGKSNNFIYNRDGSLTIYPNEEMDGFYIVKIVKK